MKSSRLLHWIKILIIPSSLFLLVFIIFYFRNIARQIEHGEKQKVEHWSQAALIINDSAHMKADELVNDIVVKGIDVPIIVVDEKGKIQDQRNLDHTIKENDSSGLKEKLEELKKTHEPIVWADPLVPSRINYYYYGNPDLLYKLKFYPPILAAIVFIFIITIIIVFTINFTSKQNTLWIGLAKETAHQLGTPITSLQGWVELLKEQETNPDIIKELEKDVDRLKLVSDRFGKIGYRPAMQEADILEEVEQMVEYIRKRAPGKVQFTIVNHGAAAIYASLAVPLFDWVIENLLKNALDAMDGEGRIIIEIKEQADTIIIDVTDNGKGISKEDKERIFAAGYSTKKRGWGVGLSLSRRIIEELHRGTLVLRQSDPGHATIFRILLNKKQSRFYRQLDRWRLLRFYNDLRNFFRR
ncbi:MAG TPA: HAMP domain-containing sensor histidine kinase [Chitinophagaceae bacterium]|nr:HAMP domain-containing sensor histidine kinase [Chitinophagaceae bacterium]